MANATRRAPTATTASTALLALLALATAAAPLAGAAAGTDDWRREARVVNAWPEGGGFAVRSLRDSGLASDELAADYDARAATLGLDLRSTAPAAGTVSLTLALLAVTEFHDADGDGRLGLGDPVVRRLDVPGSPATSALQALPDGGWRATATHTLPAPAGSLPATGTTRLEVALEARARTEGGREPTRLDLDVRVLDGWARNGTHLAVEAMLAAADAPDEVHAGAATVRGGEHRLAFAWQDGQGNVVEEGDERSLTFVRAQPAGHVASFPAALSASWLPDGGGGGADPGGHPLLYVLAAGGAAAAFLVPAWRRLRSA